MLAAKLDAYVDDLLWRAAAEHEPHVEAVLLGDARYTDALLAVDQARRDFEEFSREDEREQYLKYVDRVLLKPAGRVGSRVPPAGKRVEVYFVGSNEPYAPEPVAYDPELLKTLQAAASAEELLADLEKAAAQGDQSAKDYLAAKKAAAT
jgi:hypothetical protein